MKIGSELVTRPALAHIVHNLRPRDRAEIFATRWSDDEDTFIDDVCAIAGVLWRVWMLDGEPVAVNGVVPMRPGVVTAAAFGTHKWPAILRPMTHWSLTYVVPVLRTARYHRGEAHVLAANTDSRRWIEFLGGEIEAVLKSYGRNREDFLLYAWDLTQDRSASHVLQQSRKSAARQFHASRRVSGAKSTSTQ
jgi:hypothetical protein